MSTSDEDCTLHIANDSRRADFTFMFIQREWSEHKHDTRLPAKAFQASTEKINKTSSYNFINDSSVGKIKEKNESLELKAQ